MIKPEEYTLPQFLSEIKGIIKDNPDKVNAMDMCCWSCVYEDKEGKHCIIGEWLSVYYPEILASLEANDGCKTRILIDSKIEVRALFVLEKFGFRTDVNKLAGFVQSEADTLKKDKSWKALKKHLI